MTPRPRLRRICIAATLLATLKLAASLLFAGSARANCLSIQATDRLAVAAPSLPVSQSAQAIGSAEHTDFTIWAFPLPPAAVEPTVELNGSPANLTDGSSDGGTLNWNVRQADHIVATMQLKAVSSTKLEETLSAKQSGTFHYGLWIKVPLAHALDVNFMEIGEGTIGKYYPYDWDVAVAYGKRPGDDGIDVAHVAPIDLVIPGFEAGGTYYAENTWRLTKLTFEGGPGAVRIGFVKSIESNNGYDAITDKLTLRQGATDTLSILAYSSIDGLLSERFGTPRAVSGRMTFLYNKEWPCQWPRCNITPAQYEAYAGTLQGLYELVIIRSFEPQAAIASAFTRHGIAPYYYMFLGAERRTSDNIFPDDRWILRDSNGAEYVAPIVSATASWGLLDIRRAEVRAYLVARAVSALSMGYKGIFFDGPAFWIGSDGRVGGNAPSASESWEYARTQLLADTKDAMTRADPSSRLGILGDRFYDGQYLADFSLKESYGESWISIDPNPYERIVKNAAATNAVWDKTYRRYTRNSLFIGQKGANPLLVGTGHQWGGAPADAWYTEIGDAYRTGEDFGESIAVMAQILRAVSEYARSAHGTTITALDPKNTSIVTYGPSVVSVPKETAVTLSTPSPMLDLSTKTLTMGATLKLKPTDRYIIAERHESDGWRWSGYGFAYLNEQNYVYGDAYFNRKPAGEPGKKLTFEFETSPGPLSGRNQPVAGNAFGSHTVYFHLDIPREINIVDSNGRITKIDAVAAQNGFFAVELPSKPDFAPYRVELMYAS